MASNLRDLILAEIKSKKEIPFERFMEMALYEPGMGYYLRNVPVIGQDGDFFTASHVGKVFGALLSRHIIRIWQDMGTPTDFHIVEIGPGMGHLANDILSSLQGSPILPHLSYHLVELNPHFAAIQRERLKNINSRLFWWKDILEIPPLSGVFICNEILDAFPVRIFEVLDGDVMEVYVGADDRGEFVEILKPAQQDLIDYLDTFAPWVKLFDRYRSEANLRIKDWLSGVRRVLKQGIVLIIDYGYDAEDYYDYSRNRGTLLCYFRHRVIESPYVNVGEQDITAHVNFTAVSRWAEEAGFSVLDYTTQHRYLLSLADEELLENLYQENPAHMIHFKTLMLPEGMGESHKVMILSAK
jgi:SAM-dependent MidA family methyltransferase